MQEARVRIYDHYESTKPDASFSFKRVWSDPLINQAKLNLKRFLRYVESSDFIRNEDISKYNSKWMKASLEHIPDALLA